MAWLPLLLVVFIASVFGWAQECCPDTSMCKSSYGYCGITDEYCGDGCQCGPCHDLSDPIVSPLSGVLTSLASETTTDTKPVLNTTPLPPTPSPPPPPQSSSTSMPTKMCTDLETFDQNPPTYFDLQPCSIYTNPNNEAHLPLLSSTCGSTLISKKSFNHGGTFEIRLRIGAGKGVVSAFNLRSDGIPTPTTDEIDWEFRGALPQTVQANYFAQNPNNFKHARNHRVKVDMTQTFVTVGFVYNASATTWVVEGREVERLVNGEIEGAYPFGQPMRVYAGIWDGSRTSGWAQGQVDYSQGPYEMVVQYIKMTYPC